jgi:hypothetical protein
MLGDPLLWLLFIYYNCTESDLSKTEGKVKYSDKINGFIDAKVRIIVAGSYMRMIINKNHFFCFLLIFFCLDYSFILFF